MRMTSHGRSSKAAKTIPLVIFSVGGRRLAARAEEVGGIWPWTPTMPVPSGTPFVNAVMRRGDEVMPVFDLADRLRVRVEESGRLCLIAKRRDGPMAVLMETFQRYTFLTQTAFARRAVRMPMSWELVGLETMRCRFFHWHS